MGVWPRSPNNSNLVLCRPVSLHQCTLLKEEGVGEVLADAGEDVVWLEEIAISLGKPSRLRKVHTSPTLVLLKMPLRSRLELNCTANVRQLWSIEQELPSLEDLLEAQYPRTRELPITVVLGHQCMAQILLEEAAHQCTEAKRLCTTPVQELHITGVKPHLTAKMDQGHLDEVGHGIRRLQTRHRLTEIMMIIRSRTPLQVQITILELQGTLRKKVQVAILIHQLLQDQFIIHKKAILRINLRLLHQLDINVSLALRDFASRN